MSANESKEESRRVFFFDIDNCLYSRKTKIHDEMFKLIDQFISKHLSLSAEDATRLQTRYYTDYGLVLEGLLRYHKIDPIVFNQEVDEALPLDTILGPDPKLRPLLARLDRRKVQPWLLTNAHISHATRVLDLLGVRDLFEGITFCDYGEVPLVCKPSQRMYERAEQEAGAQSPDQCVFVDDSFLNCKHARLRGWTTVHLLEPGLDAPPEAAGQYLISGLEELPIHFPHFFLPDS
ncbi:HAD-superfamily hydrolase subfamily IA variant 3 [Penicillium capsulatum]|nr:HAD-superfamily hydrolase subfamily IA variant 3 [Penicillium capsulatum]